MTWSTKVLSISSMAWRLIINAAMVVSIVWQIFNGTGVSAAIFNSLIRIGFLALFVQSILSVMRYRQGQRHKYE
jgi:uncharacterized membrane protein YfbV (UPF0208 family)